MTVRSDLYHGLFHWHPPADGQQAALTKAEDHPTDLPDPLTGRPLRIATIEVSATAICPACSHQAHGGYVSFVADLRLAYACPACCELIWIHST